MKSTIKKFISTQTTEGVRKSLKNLWREFQIQQIHQASLKKFQKMPLGDRLNINFGCGSNIKSGWINVDLSNKADLQLDPRENMPFKNNSASMIYSEHFFEHLEYPTEAKKFLRESLRILMSGGLFSVAVPDTEWPIKAYVNNEEEYFQIAQTSWHPKWCDTRMHNINYHFRNGISHKYAYDFETLKKILEQTGFVSIEKREFNPALDSEKRKLGTLYVDAKKPH